MTIKTQATKVFAALLEAKKRFVVLQGSSRSSKSYSIAQHIVLQCVNEWAGKKKVITISRKTFPALRASVMRDFFTILESLRLYDEKHHNKTTNEYTLKGNLIEFVAVDQPQKVRGRKRDICWLNEANEFDYDDFFQFNIRTTGQIYLDYNPSDEFHWIYEKVLGGKDCDYIHSTFRDNPFLEKSLVAELEGLAEIDENLWQIYGLGERGKSQDLVYPDWFEASEFPAVCEHYRYGLDWGYNHPTALVLIGIREKDIYLREIIYQSHLTNQDLIDLMCVQEVSKSILIRADSAEPDRIEEVGRAGYRIEPARKSHTLNKDAVDHIKRLKIHIVNSPNIVKEIKNYCWKRDKSTNTITDEPVKFKDDCHDEQTEILTKKGWKLFKDLEQQNEVATLNKNGYIEWYIPTRHICQQYKGKMFLYKSNSINFCVSPNHRMVTANQYSVVRKKNPIYKFTKIENLPILSWMLTVGMTNGQLMLDSILAEFIGFWLAEGCKSITRGKRYVNVDNQDYNYLQQFKSAFGGSLYKTKNCYRLSIRSDYLYNLLPNGVSYTKYIPDFIYELTPTLIEKVIEGAIKGDGTKSKQGGVSYTSTSKKLIDGLQVLSFMVGKKTNVYKIADWRYDKTPSGISWCRPVWRLSWSKEKRGATGMGLAPVSKRNIKVVEYDGYIYCVEVENHIIATRRNGKIVWGGNSMDCIKYAIGDILEDSQLFRAVVSQDTAGQSVMIGAGV